MIRSTWILASVLAVLLVNSAQAQGPTFYGQADVSFLARFHPQQFSLRTDGNAGTLLGVASETQINDWLQASFRTEVGFSIVDGAGAAPSCSIAGGAAGETCSVSLAVGSLGLVNREAWVALGLGRSTISEPRNGGGQRHQFRFGRWYAPVFSNQARFSNSVFGLGNPTILGGARLATNAVRFNGVTYLSPSYAGFSAVAMLGVGEMNSWKWKAGDLLGARIAYTLGGFNAQLAAQLVKSPDGDIASGSAGASCTAGAFLLSVLGQHTRVLGEKPWHGTFAQVYAAYTLGDGLFGVSAGWLEVPTSDDAGQVMLSYRHRLSDALTLYAKAAYLLNKHDAAYRPPGVNLVQAGDDVTGAQVGATYTF